MWKGKVRVIHMVAYFFATPSACKARDSTHIIVILPCLMTLVPMVIKLVCVNVQTALTLIFMIVCVYRCRVPHPVDAVSPTSEPANHRTGLEAPMDEQLQLFL